MFVPESERRACRRTPPARLTEPFDRFFEVFGNQSFAAVQHLQAPHGRYVTAVPKRRDIVDHARTLLCSFRITPHLTFGV